jgi:hypothetical protein
MKDNLELGRTRTSELSVMGWRKRQILSLFNAFAMTAATFLGLRTGALSVLHRAQAYRSKAPCDGGGAVRGG